MRKVQVMHLGPRFLKPLLTLIEFRRPPEWQKDHPHLYAAYEILTRELKVSSKVAVELIRGSVLAAAKCAEAINNQSNVLTEGKTRAKLGVAFKRLANCASRASKKLRVTLDAAAQEQFASGDVDDERIQEFLDAAFAAFRKFAYQKAAQTALRGMQVEYASYEEVNTMKAGYESLGHNTRNKCESCLSELCKRKKGVEASAVFKCLEKAIRFRRPRRDGVYFITQIKSEYAGNVVELWRNAELNPVRTYIAGKSACTGGLHGFCELVLTAVADPWTKRHDKDRDETAKKIWKRHYRQEWAKEMSAAMPQSDIIWQIGDHHLRIGLQRQLGRFGK